VADLTRAHKDIEKLLKSKKMNFVGGSQGLQLRHSQAIECHLRLMVTSGRQWKDMSEQAAESQGFAMRWGGRQTRSWT
jgi:hypothetical protein